MSNFVSLILLINSALILAACSDTTITPPVGSVVFPLFPQCEKDVQTARSRFFDQQLPIEVRVQKFDVNSMQSSELVGSVTLIAHKDLNLLNGISANQYLKAEAQSILASCALGNSKVIYIGENSITALISSESKSLGKVHSVIQNEKLYIYYNDGSYKYR